MTEARTYAWIFYATAASRNEDGATRGEIESVADGINHAFPTQKEMDESLKWAEAQNLIRSEGKTVFVTEGGSQLASQHTSQPGGVMKVWERYTRAFEKMGADNTVELDCRTMEPRR